MEMPVLYEDADVLAVNKLAGVMTHPSFAKATEGKLENETASEWFGKKYPEGGYAHRLDRDTSGVLVFAKNPDALAFLKKAFHDREVKKTYLAFVYGVPKERKGTISFDIGRSRKDFRLRSAQPKARGTLRAATTRYEVIADIKTHALLKVEPETGRTHQIRVHLKAIHHPIVGDKLYAPGLSKSEVIGNKPQSFRAPSHPCDLGFERLGLHAYALDLPLPNGGRVRITAPVPGELVPALARFPGGNAVFAAS